MYVLNIPEGPLTIPKKDSEIIISTDESDTYFNIKIEVKSKDINETYNYEYNNYHIDRSSIELLKLLGTKDTNTLLDKIIDYSKDVYGYVDNFAEGLTKTEKTRISNKNLKLYFEKPNGYVFYGNQYVKTYSLKKIGEQLGDILKWVGVGFDAIEIYGAYEEDGGVGEKTKKTIVKIGGSYAGGSLGASVGFIIGTTVLGILTGGVGIPAVAAITGFLGTAVGGYVGGEIGEDISVELYEKLAE